MRILILFMMGVCLVSCKNETKQHVHSTINSDFQKKELVDNSEMSVVDIPEFKDMKEITYSELFSGVEYIHLETNSKSLIGFADQLQIVDDKIYILDSFNSQSLFVFDLSGKFIRKIGDLGKGPGEYLLPLDFSIDLSNKEIVILDDQQHKILRYSLTGEFKREHNLSFRFHEFSVLNDSTNIISLASSDNIDIMKELNKYSIIYTNADFSEIKSSIVAHHPHMVMNLSRSNDIVKSSGDTYFNQIGNDTIFSLTETGAKPVVKINNPYEVPEKMLTTKDSDDLKKEGYIGHNSDFQFNSSPIFFNGVDLFMKFKKKQFVYTYYKNLKSDTTYYGNAYVNDLEYPFLGISEQRQITDSTLITVTNADNIKQYIEDNPEQKFSSGIQDIEAYDNPVVGIFKLKQ